MRTLRKPGSTSSPAILLLLLLILLHGCAPAMRSGGAPASSSAVTVMSYNIRYDNPGDGDNRWDLRRDHLSSLVAFHDVDFLGTQEGLLRQLQHLDLALPGMSRIGVGRDDGREQGEFSAIYYNRERFELVDGSERTLWLSENPSVPERSWDAALPRVLTFGRFVRKSDGKTFFVFNTHFDHVGVEARRQSALQILRVIEETAGDLPVIVTGDFNVTPTSEPYGILTAESSPLRDAFHHTRLPHVGPTFSFGGFMVHEEIEERRIDYVLVNDGVDVLKHAIISAFRAGRYPSDHLPVIAVVELR